MRPPDLRMPPPPRDRDRSLTIRERNEWLETGNAAVATGTWNVVRETREYAQRRTATAGSRSRDFSRRLRSPITGTPR